jgi:hypothetical protein
MAAAGMLCAPPGAFSQTAFQELKALASDARAPAAATPAAETPAPMTDDATRNRTDVTPEYRRAWDDPDAALPPSAVERLRGCKVLLVPGFMANVYIVLGSRPLARRFQQGGYFDDQMRWLSANGIENERVEIQSEQTPEFNEEILARAIEASDKPVILYTHSKGSLDVLETLVRRPDLRAKVEGWISIQGALLGSPVADYIAGSKILSWKFTLILRVLGGNLGSLESLTTRASRERYARDAAEIARVFERVPFVAFASWKDPDPVRTNTLMEFSRDLMEKTGLKNDGLMPTMNAVLPGQAYVMIPGVDHTDPYMSGFETFDRVRFTRALLAVLLGRIDRAAP